MLAYLLSIAEDNDRNKVEYLYRHFHKDMLRFALSRLSSHIDKNVKFLAEDVVQDAFVKLIKYLDKIDFNQDERALKNYVFSVVHNECINVLKDVKKTLSIDNFFSSSSEDAFLEHLIIQERYREVVRLIEEMDERYSTVLLFHYCHEMKPKEISQLLGINIKTVYTRLERGKKLLLALCKDE